MRSSCDCEKQGAPTTEIFGIHHDTPCEENKRLSQESASILAEILSQADEAPERTELTT